MSFQKYQFAVGIPYLLLLSACSGTAIEEQTIEGTGEETAAESDSNSGNGEISYSETIDHTIELEDSEISIEV